jgi:hypothetical protein
MRDYAAACVAAERERWRAGLMKMHEQALGRHNYYHVAAVALMEEK